MKRIGFEPGIFLFHDPNNLCPSNSDRLCYLHLDMRGIIILDMHVHITFCDVVPLRENQLLFEIDPNFRKLLKLSIFNRSFIYKLHTLLPSYDIENL